MKDGLGEVIVFICGMATSSVEERRIKPTEIPANKKKRLSSYYAKRDEEYDRARQVQGSDNDDESLSNFKKRCTKKYPNCVVLSAAKIQCGKCDQVIIFSCPRSIRNFERHMDTHVHATVDPDQRSILSFVPNRNAGE